jgi:hypothetical protein
VWNSNEAALLTNRCNSLRWRESNLDGALNEERDHVSIARAHFGTNKNGNARDLRVACPLCAVNAIMVGDCEVGDPTSCSGARKRDWIAQ